MTVFSILVTLKESLKKILFKVTYLNKSNLKREKEEKREKIGLLLLRYLKKVDHPYNFPMNCSFQIKVRLFYCNKKDFFLLIFARSANKCVFGSSENKYSERGFNTVGGDCEHCFMHVFNFT